MIQNLKYNLQVIYKNDIGDGVSIFRELCDDGFETRSIQVGEKKISEAMINGRILSGKFEDKSLQCGYLYNYDRDDEEYLTRLNQEISIETATALINKTKMLPEFLSAKMVFSSLLRNDYRIFAMKNGEINVIKTLAADNEKGEKCVFQENIVLSKIDEEEMFKEIRKERTYKIEDIIVGENTDSGLKELVEVLKKNPNSCTELIGAQNKVQEETAAFTV